MYRGETQLDIGAVEFKDPVYIYKCRIFQQSSIVRREIRARNPDLGVISIDVLSENLGLYEMTRKKV